MTARASWRSSTSVGCVSIRNNLDNLCNLKSSLFMFEVYGVVRIINEQDFFSQGVYIDMR